MKFISTCVLFGLVFSQSVSASTCVNDTLQMQEQISKYQSISTKGCPFNPMGWGINRISQPQETSSQICSSTCSYAAGQGSNGISCSWEKGNWGNTLTCNS